MNTVAEVTRLRDVYRQYAESGFAESKWSSANKGNQAIRCARDLRTCRLLEQAGFMPFGNRRILEVGCGSGEELGKFTDWGALPENLFGIDLIPERVRAAQKNFPRCIFQIANAEALPFAEGSFELVTLYTVFTSILDAQMARNVASEINRVLAPAGGVLWYDFRLNNPFNQNVRPMQRRHIYELFPGYRITLESLSLLPPLARHLGVFTKSLYHPLSLLPFLRSHYLGLFIKS